MSQRVGGLEHPLAHDGCAPVCILILYIILNKYVEL
jgi:hypothetical protein